MEPTLEIWKRGTPEGRVYTRNHTTKDLSQDWDKEKVCTPPREKQTLLEMGTGGGGRGKRKSGYGCSWWKWITTPRRHY